MEDETASTSISAEDPIDDPVKTASTQTEQITYVSKSVDNRKRLISVGTQCSILYAAEKNISVENIAKKRFSEIGVNTESSILQQSRTSAHVISCDSDSEDSNTLNETENYADTSFRTEDGEESSESEEDYVEAAEQSSPTDE